MTEVNTEHEFSPAFVEAEGQLLDCAAKLRAQADGIHRNVAGYRAAVVAAAKKEGSSTYDFLVASEVDPWARELA